MVDPGFQKVLLDLAVASTSGGFISVAYKAVFAGWLIALMAWLIGSTRSTGTQIVFVWLTTAPISAFGFRHSVAGSVEAFYRAFSNNAGWGQMIGGFVVPALIGNIIGGVIFVALLNHGQVAADKAADSLEEKENQSKSAINYT